MLLYIIGTIMIIFSLPLVFLPSLTNFYLILMFSCFYKIGSGLTIISQLTIVPKITSNRNRRVNLWLLVEKIGIKDHGIRVGWSICSYGFPYCFFWVCFFCVEILCRCLFFHYIGFDLFNRICLQATRAHKKLPITLIKNLIIPKFLNNIKRFLQNS